MRSRVFATVVAIAACRAAPVDAVVLPMLVGDAGVVVDAGHAMTADAGTATGVGDAGWPQCPANAPGTGDIAGASITREGFGCFGGCGPSCKAECLDDTLTISLAAALGCTQCTYKVTTCKSHEFCRWHDDCYRQCDLRWAASHAEAPKTPPSNPCYLNCDNPVVHASTLCGADWSQLFSSSGSVRDACWDGSLVVLTTLTSSQHSSSTCGADDVRARPWAPDTGAWGDAAPVPKTLPHGYSCTDDTDCPDRNQRCDPKAGDYPGVNGWGRCIDVTPSRGLDVTPLPAAGTRVVGQSADGGVPCDFGYDCRSGHCEHSRCR